MPVPSRCGPGPCPRSAKAVPKEPERQWRKGFVKRVSFKSGVKGRGSDRWWERRWGLWCDAFIWDL